MALLFTEKKSRLLEPIKPSIKRLFLDPQNAFTTLVDRSEGNFLDYLFDSSAISTGSSRGLLFINQRAIKTPQTNR